VTPPVPEQPLATLPAFHKSIRLALEAFGATAGLASVGLCDVIKASALVDFFVGPMRWHDEDETRSLLPRLLARDPALQGAIDDCAAAHAHMERALDDVLDHLRAIASGAMQPDAALLLATHDELRQVLEPHLHREEHELFPAAEALLDAAALREIALEMHARRLLRLAVMPASPRKAPDTRAT
jgi:hypothetical protein